MAEKKVANVIKLQIPAGAANPAPPVGPALGAAGVNIMQFCQAFNAETQDKKGDIIPVEISVYEDKSFSFITKTPPAAHLIKKELNLKSGSAKPQADKVGQLSQEQLTKIADALVARGCVSRSSDEKNRRVILLSLTEEGRALVRALQDEVVERMLPQFGRLDESELQEFSQAADTIRRLLDKVKN